MEEDLFRGLNNEQDDGSNPKLLSKIGYQCLNKVEEREQQLELSMTAGLAASGLMVGARVVRGPEWKWGNQDDGEGHIGTVLEIATADSETMPLKTVMVQWDNGFISDYRAGYQGTYDLRLFDNAAAGVRHTNVKCHACNQTSIAGVRWNCFRCKDYNLCSPCYHANQHYTTHQFIRLAMPNSKGVIVSKRKGSATLEAKGIFAGAIVERGPRWELGDQDGGEGKLGKVIDIRGGPSETERSLVNVLWNSGSANVYCLGYEGKSNLKYKIPASGGCYYKDHLPILGESPSCPLIVGDHVKVKLEFEVLQIMQQGHGGWDPEMAKYIHDIGTVQHITDNGDVTVQYDGCRLAFHPDALMKMHEYKVGDAVMVINNFEKVMKLQKDLGVWTDSLIDVLGCIGKVVKVSSDGNIRVCVNSRTWTLNSLCCVAQPQDQLQENDNKHRRTKSSGRATTSNAGASDFIFDDLAIMLDQISNIEDPPNPNSLVKQAAQGHLEVVKYIIARYPEQVNAKYAGVTALQKASHQGDLDMVASLLKARANVEIKDEDGDTALHYSAFGNQPQITQLLLQNQSNINSVNNAGCSTLHVAVSKQNLDCVKVLLDNNCDVNIQDIDGETALHNSIGEENTEIIAALTEHPNVDLTLKNHKGFNALHHAALKGNSYATELILARCRELVDVKKYNGLSALHLAAINGHLLVTQVLVEKGDATIEIRSNCQQTPLMLAVTQGHLQVVKYLVEKGSTVNASDEDGDSVLHLAISRQSTVKQDKSSPQLTDKAMRELTLYLLEQGADVRHENNQGRTPLDLASDSKLRSLIKKYITEVRNCIVCEQHKAVVLFKPCGHKVACLFCCKKMKKCLSCRCPIEWKLQPDGSVITADRKASASVLAAEWNYMEDLKNRIHEIEDSVMCVICCDRRHNVAFLCGHTACKQCATPLIRCHVCLKPITKRITLKAH